MLERTCFSVRSICLSMCNVFAIACRSRRFLQLLAKAGRVKHVISDSLMSYTPNDLHL